MKIIGWNCNMAFRKKISLITALEPDIAVIPECEHPDRLKFPNTTSLPHQTLWFGNNLNKGLGIFSFNKINLRLLDCHNPMLKQIIPIEVTAKRKSFILFAIWAHNPDDPDGTYIEQVWKAIDHYENFLSDKKTILIGDFNSNTIWDKPRRIGNHSHVVNRLEQKDIHSCYHLHHQQLQGKEIHPTLYMYRHKNKPYHIDYCFASADLVKKIKAVQIGDYDGWSPYSDHMPVIVTFN